MKCLPPSKQQQACTECKKAAHVDGCSRIQCPGRKPWCTETPIEHDHDPICVPGGHGVYGYKTRAQKGQP